MDLHLNLKILFKRQLRPIKYGEKHIVDNIGPRLHWEYGCEHLVNDVGLKTKGTIYSTIYPRP